MTQSLLSNKKIAIIGGGPAGLFSAYLLSDRKLNNDIILFEKDVLPKDKVCGEGIMSSGVDILKKYNLLDLFSSNEVFRFKGIKYISANGKHVAVGKFPNNEFGLGLRRTLLSQRLYEKLVHKCGEPDAKLEIKTNHRFVSFYRESNNEITNEINAESTITLSVENLVTKTTEKFSGIDHILACDGRLSSVRQFLKLEDSLPYPPIRVGISVHLEVEPWSELVEVYWGDLLEAYVTPLSQKSIGIIVTHDKDLKVDKLDPFALLPILKEKIISSKAKIIDKPKILTNFAHQSQIPQTDDVTFLGDSLIFMDGITGEGLSLVLEGIDNLLTNGISEQYKKNAIIKQKHYRFITKLALINTKFLFFQNLFIIFLSKFPKVFNHLIEVNMGRKKLYEFNK